MANLCRVLLAIVALSCLTAHYASAQQMPTEFNDLIASNQPKLTPEQATQIAGFYNKTEMVRLTGDAVDHALKAALMAALEADEAAVDFANVTAQALKDSDIVKEYSFWIPHIDPTSGFFFAFRVLKSASDQVTFPDVKRFVGSAMARTDGSVLLVATNDQDTAIWQGIAKNDSIYLNYMEGGELWDATGTTLLEDQTIFTAVLEKVPAPTKFLNRLKDSLPLHVNKEGSSGSAAAASGAARGGGGGTVSALLLSTVVAAVISTVY